MMPARNNKIIRVDGAMHPDCKRQLQDKMLYVKRSLV